MAKIKLTRKHLIVVISLSGAFTALMIYMIFYMPLTKKVKAKYFECKSAEKKTLECRNIVESAGNLYEKKVLMKESDAHRVIDELTGHGRDKGINFISINSEKIRKAKNSRYKILPVKMKIESTYEKFAEFLGSLDDLEKGLVKVKSFSITSAEEGSFKLRADLAADIYLSGRDYGE